MTRFVAHPMDRFCLLFGLLMGACATQGGPRVLECTLTYGGESKTVRVPPTDDPYRVKLVEISSRLSWKAIYVTEPNEEAALNIYTYAVSDEASVLIHQAKYKPPYSSTTNFTGVQTVYEPRIGSDVHYACGWAR